MKLALFVPGGVDRSGEHHVVPALLWLVERLARRHDVHVYAREQEPLPGDWPLLGAKVHNIGTAAGLRRRLYDAFAAEHARAPFDVAHGIFGWGGTWAALLGKRHEIPVVYHVAGGELVDLRDINYGMRATLRGRVASDVALRGARRVTVASGPMRQQARARGVAAEIVPLGVALDRWPPLAPRPRDPAAPLRILHVGDLRPVKDQATLLAAVIALRESGIDAELDVCGLDTLAGSLQRSAPAMALGTALRWHGHAGRAIVRRMMECADVLAVTSRHEAGPVVVLEAAVAGVPTAGTAVGHIADWAPDAAIATPVGDARALAAALASLARDDRRRLRIAAEAQRRAIAADADHTASEFERIYDELVAR